MHAKPTDANAHPHTDSTGEIAIVHDGIIENYLEFKHELADHWLTSETDIEIIAHLLEETLEDDLREAVESVVDRL
jgi:glucosamine--fructose-6-phosphate aminotransferase (isomerizing)